ncbi:spore coat protein [Brevibacillus fulvus]|uniref:Spore coat protein CotF n=1 Tax=Brevibacillus fulvus TaxID=1125967 RepID=A0A938XVR6_9BACL|nr:spore coat protein [Brevibacillus fulvus]MBM7591368.1 spore coat protein CotF [Brevibacillus fulvus]
MNNDYLDVSNAIGMPKLIDSAVALDFLLAVKNSVRTCAFALTETATAEVRTVLEAQLEKAIDLHDELTQLMINKGWLHPIDLSKQFTLDFTSAQTAAKIAGWPLFPADTDRRGTFATPNQ